MAISETTSALIAAFQFGIVVNAASAALFFNVKGHGSSSFLDGKRLALTIFFLSSALWAQIDFITIIIGPTAATSCQVGVIFTTVFDQLARYSIEQHLLWVINAGTEAGVGQYIPQGLLAGRFVLGAVFVGFSSHQMDTICAPISSNLALAIAVVAVDAAVVMILAARAASVGVFKRIKDGGQQSARGKAVVAILVGLAVWMATSAVMLLGISTIDYLFRSTVPAGGLVILIIAATTSSSVLLDTQTRGRERNIPEAPSPGPIATARFITTSDSSDYPPSRYEDLKAFVQPRDVPLPGQGVPNVGVGGVPIQGQLFPPMRSTTAPTKATMDQPREKSKSFFKASKKPAKAVTVGKFSISNPVLLEGGSNPLDKVATIDLQTAARQERERRMGTISRSPSTIRSEAIAAELRQARRAVRTTSTVAEEVISQTPEPSMTESAPLAVGSASGAQLSPGSEDLRRRSPRHTPSTLQGPTQSMVMLEPNWIPSPTLKSAGRALPQNQDVIVNTDIERPLPAPPSPEAMTPEPDQMPLQRRPTNGLAANPMRTTARRPSTSEPQRQETVMFVNNIVYDDPEFVAGILDDAREQGPKTFIQASSKKAAPTSQPEETGFTEMPGSPVSVVNRPRPVPRRRNTSGMDTYFPPIGHRKSKSAGALGHKSHILRSGPGSPTTLPPLPPPPPTPIMVARPKPNNTKSMTYTEKMALLFPQPQNTGASRRRSSLPTLPGTPISSIGNSPTLAANGGRDTRWWGSKETTSVQIRSLFQEEQEQAPQKQVSMDAPKQQLSTRTYQGMVNEMDEGILPEDGATETKSSVVVMKNGKRASSPVLPPRMSFRSATTIDDDSTGWDAAISPAPVPRTGLAVPQAHDQRVISGMTNQSGEIEIGMMLDRPAAREIGPESKSMAPAGMNSTTTEATLPTGIWHHRIGEETPRFSSRSRRGTPPVPLVLSDRPTLAKQTTPVQAAIPSPLPSPEEAFQMIEAQLKKYDQPFRDSLESTGQGQLALLNDLEREMGQQETRWANMQQDFHASRDSSSTLGLSSATGTPHTSKNAVFIDTVTEEADQLSRNPSTRSGAGIAAERRAARQARMANLSSTRTTSRKMDNTTSSRASLWQKRLEEAQMEYLEHANEISRKRNTNFSSVSKADLGSPTPPDSDESDTENETWRQLAVLLEAQDKQQVADNTTKFLWAPPQAPEGRSGHMWVRPDRPYKQHLPSQDPPLPGLSLRPSRRRESTTLYIESRELWEKPTSNTAANTHGLWKSPAELQRIQEATMPTPAPAPQNQPPSYYNPGIQRSKTTTGSRPLTQRPPRRSKRITALPDIVEEPQPLPDKRGTLGIFQFPWGERSDVAWVQPRPAMFTAMPGTMAARGTAIADALEERANQLELEDYSASFFDDFDEDQSESDYSDYAGSESDDEGFDESTLWEIANMLKTDDVPSRLSMFPSQLNAAGFMVADYLTEEPEQYGDVVTRQTILDSVEEPDGLQEMPSPMPPSKSPKRTQSTLWQATRDTEEALTHDGKGLPQPGDWQVYDQMTQTTRVRSMAKASASAQPAAVESDTLWVPATTNTEGSKSPLWAPPRTKESSTPKSQDLPTLSPEPSARMVMSPKTAWGTLLWRPEHRPRIGEHGVGLPQPEGWASYEVAKSSVRAKPRPSELNSVESVNLWQAPSEQPGTRNWLQPLRALVTSGLWQINDTHKKNDHGVGLPQPDNWGRYNGGTSNLRAKPRLSEPDVIKSVHLWQPPQSSEMSSSRDWLQASRTIASTTCLWQVEEKPKESEHGVGLPHPQDWEKYNLIQATTRSKPRQSQPAAIESVDLWRVPRSSAATGTKNWLSSPRALATTSRLWQATGQLHKGGRTVGLPQPTDWESRDITTATVRTKLRPSGSALIESVDLWQAQFPEFPAPPSKMWSPKMQSAPVM